MINFFYDAKSETIKFGRCALVGFILMFLLLFCLLFLASYFTRENGIGTPGPKNPNRFEVERHGSFSAGYLDHAREIVIIKDTLTNKEYLGITGVGVTEMYKSGKHFNEE